MSPPGWELREMNVPWRRLGTTEYLRSLYVRDILLPYTTSENYFLHYKYKMYTVTQLTAIVLLYQ